MKPFSQVNNRNIQFPWNLPKALHGLALNTCRLTLPVLLFEKSQKSNECINQNTLKHQEISLHEQLLYIS